MRDIDTKAPLVGVTVAVNSVFGSRMSHDGYSITTTDQQGRYRIEGLPLVPKGVRRYEGNRFRISPIGKPYFENHNVMCPLAKTVDRRSNSISNSSERSWREAAL